MVGVNELRKMNRKLMQKKEVIVSSRSSYHQPRGMRRDKLISLLIYFILPKKVNRAFSESSTPSSKL